MNDIHKCMIINYDKIQWLGREGIEESERAVVQKEEVGHIKCRFSRSLARRGPLKTQDCLQCEGSNVKEMLSHTEQESTAVIRRKPPRIQGRGRNWYKTREKGMPTLTIFNPLALYSSGNHLKFFLEQWEVLISNKQKFKIFPLKNMNAETVVFICSNKYTKTIRNVPVAHKFMIMRKR